MAKQSSAAAADGSSRAGGFVVRPIEPGDKASLEAAIEHSSAEAIYRRFLNPHGRLTAAELRYFTEVDHHNHEALVAVDAVSGEGIGVARYVRESEQEDAAEVAFAVLESWQGRGVGKTLLRHLAERARSEGISRFTALMLATNEPMRRLLAELGDPTVMGSSYGTVELAVELQKPVP